MAERTRNASAKPERMEGTRILAQMPQRSVCLLQWDLRLLCHIYRHGLRLCYGGSFVPKSADPQQAYEWNNYRLSSFRPNSAKRDAVSIMDPFALRKWTFFINFSNGEVRPNDRLPVDEKIKVDETIKILKLNASEITRKRAEDFSAYIAGMVTLEYLVKYSPFVAEEITRQHLELA